MRYHATLLWAAGAAVLALAAAPALADSDAALLNRASGGYVYFHLAGADMAGHDAAVDACAHEASQTKAPYVAPVIGGLITRMAVASAREAKHRRLNEAQFAANLENCMVARGWEVVRLAGGRAIAASPQAQQAPRRPDGGGCSPRGRRASALAAPPSMSFPARRCSPAPSTPARPTPPTWRWARRARRHRARRAPEGRPVDGRRRLPVRGLAPAGDLPAHLPGRRTLS